MPGAQPSANPAQREEFEQRCRQLYQEQVYEERVTYSHAAGAAGNAATVEDLQAMFPAFDADLVQTLCSESPTPQQALDTLLALSHAVTEPMVEAARPPSPPPRYLGVESHEKFPSLASADGWQIPNQCAFDREDEELGSCWRDRAKANAAMPAPLAPPRVQQTAWSVARLQRRSQEKKENAEDGGLLETDYEFRHRVGKRRANNRAQFGRGGACGRGARGYAGSSADARNGGDKVEPEGLGQPEGESE